MNNNAPRISELCNLHNSRICCGRGLADSARRNFWMIYVDGTRGPERKYRNRYEAEQEARRLAEKEGGIPVYMLESEDGYLYPKSAPEKFSTRTEAK